jgi:lysophospholipase L1-like esterase
VIRRLAALVLGFAGLAAGTAACHKHSPTQPCTTADCAPVETLSLTCPSDVSLTTSSYTVTSAMATYAAPTVTGGTPPVTSSCAPASGTVFASGTTAVTCKATDAIARAATCSLHVTVNVPPAPVPILQGTVFIAFGDSITEGENGCNDPCTLSIDPDRSYPAVLKQLLSARYTQQTIAMDPPGSPGSYGQGGETAKSGAVRLANDLHTLVVPDALLLLEGANDFDNNESPSDVIDALRQDIQNAKTSGVKRIFLATLPPEIAGGSRAYALSPTDQLTPTNALIRSLAAAEDVVLVDLFNALNGNVRQYVSDPDSQASDGEFGDGLHLTVAGRALVAQTFFAAIQANFEVAPAMQRAPTRLSPNRLGPAIRR